MPSSFLLPFSKEIDGRSKTIRNLGYCLELQQEFSAWLGVGSPEWKRYKETKPNTLTILLHLGQDDSHFSGGPYL